MYHKVQNDKKTHHTKRPITECECRFCRDADILDSLELHETHHNNGQLAINVRPVTNRSDHLHSTVDCKSVPP